METSGTLPASCAPYRIPTEDLPKLWPAPEVRKDITFHAGGVQSEPIMRLDAEGLWYKGELCKDAGEAHRAFMEFMNKANSSL